VYLDALSAGLGGGRGSAVLSVSDAATRMDQWGLNGLVTAGTAVVTGLENAGSAAERFAKRVDALLHDAGQPHQAIGPRAAITSGGSWLMPPGLSGGDPGVGFLNTPSRR
jgi:hypothetical protein